MDASVAPEANDGVQLTWQYCRSTKAQHDALPVPFSAVVTLLHNSPSVQQLDYAPVQCGKCKAALNCYCTVEYGKGVWTCPLCGFAQGLPTSYRGMSEQYLPAELYPGANVVEYTLPSTAQQPKSPICVFVLDLCVAEEDIEPMKSSIEQAVSMLPDSTRVGIITFGSMVYAHEMVVTDLPACLLFRGNRETTKKEFVAAMGRGPKAAAPGGGFLAPLAECEYAIEGVLETLRPEFAQLGHRPQRCTGAALSVAVSLLEALASGEGGHVLLFTAGPCTVGPGRVVETDYADAIRTHKDLVKGRAKWYAKAAKFYDGLAHRLIECGQCLDVLACSLDQVGLAEMQHMVTCTGGLMVMAETFDHDVYRRSLARLLRTDASDQQLTWALNGTLELHTSACLGVRGAIAPCASLEQRTPSTIDPPIGLGGTAAWKLNALDGDTDIALYFQPTATSADKAPAAGSPLYFQVKLSYQHASGQRRLRVVTKATYWTEPAAPPASLGFDQHTAAVVMARWCAYDADQQHDTSEICAWLDRQLIGLTQRVCAFTKNQPDSLLLAPDYVVFPEYMFHLRRSSFLNVFNNTPDETVYYRLLLFRESLAACLLMLRPRLLMYPVDGSPVAEEELDIAAVRPDCVAFFDSWFNIVVHTGSHVAMWRKQGLLDDPNYGHVKEAVDAAHAHAHQLMAERNPLPRLVVCDQGTSQARFLLVRLNPSKTQENTDGQAIGSVIYTDDVSFNDFLVQLKKLSVS